MSLFRSHERALRELRESPRFDVHYPAYIEIPDGSLRSCIICDISASGAKLTVGGHEVPPEFTLRLKLREEHIAMPQNQRGAVVPVDLNS